MKISSAALKRSRFLPHSVQEFAVFLLCFLFFAVRNIPVLLYGGQVFAFAVILFYNARRIPVRQLIPWILLVLWSLISMLWVSNISHGWKFIREVGQVTAVAMAFLLYARTEERQEHVLAMICTCGALMIVYFIFRTPFSEWRRALYTTASVASSSDRFGRTIGLHPNGFGSLCAILAALWLYQWRKYGVRIGLPLAGVLVLFMLFSKSRASILMFVLVVAVYWVVEKRRTRKMLLRIAGAALLIGTALWAVMNVGFLYQLVGRRIAGVLAFVTGEGTVDSSITGRNRLIEAGREMIRDHPFFGVGAGNYSNNAYESYGTWRDVYAHNNYIEIWADLGLVGLLIYYLPRFICLIRLLKIRTRKNDDPLCALFIALLAGMLVTDYGKISYSSEAQQILYALAAMYTLIHSVRRRQALRRQALMARRN